MGKLIKFVNKSPSQRQFNIITSVYLQPGRKKYQDTPLPICDRHLLYPDGFLFYLLHFFVRCRKILFFVKHSDNTRRINILSVFENQYQRSNFLQLVCHNYGDTGICSYWIFFHKIFYEIYHEIFA